MPLGKLFLPLSKHQKRGGIKEKSVEVAKKLGSLRQDAALILCQITSRAHSDAFAVPLDHTDFERGQLPQPGFIRPQRLFTAEHHIILHSVGKVTS